MEANEPPIRPVTRGQRLIGLLSLLAAGVMLWFLLKPVNARHVVIIVADTLRRDHLSVYGYGQPTNPFLSSKAKEWIRYDRAQSPAPWTVPSHASMFTGLRPGRHRAQWGSPRLKRDFVTLADVLRAQGFWNVALSSNPFVSRKSGLAQGFHRFDVVQGKWEDRSDNIVAALPKILDQRAVNDSKMFLFINLMDTHIPYNTRDFGDQFGVEGPGPVANSTLKWKLSAGKMAFGPEQRDAHARAYDAAVRKVDQVIGDLYGALGSHGLLEDTVVLITSDHGDGLGEHTELGHSISVWEEQLAVPLLVRMPGAQGGGIAKGHRASLRSVAPSVLRWLGVDSPISMRATPLLDEPGFMVASEYRSYFSEGARVMNKKIAESYPELASGVQHSHVLYCGDGKLIVRADGSYSFFDLAQDPTEQNDLAASNLDSLSYCHASYTDEVKEGLLGAMERQISGMQVDLPDEESLRSLGYVQ
jgi:arylsulfatase A-like enzyme